MADEKQMVPQDITPEQADALWRALVPVVRSPNLGTQVAGALVAGELLARSFHVRPSADPVLRALSGLIRGDQEPATPLRSAFSCVRTLLGAMTNPRSYSGAAREGLLVALEDAPGTGRHSCPYRIHSNVPRTEAQAADTKSYEAWHTAFTQGVELRRALAGVRESILQALKVHP